jgi:hypothetical protein
MARQPDPLAEIPLIPRLPERYPSVRGKQPRYALARHGHLLVRVAGYGPVRRVSIDFHF